MAEKILLSWSGGKDSAMALYEIQKGSKYAVRALLTTVTEGYDRISMHGVRRALLEKQADALGLPLEKVYIPKNATNEEYETQMRALLERYCREGIKVVAFGDIFLEDLRQYREKNLAQIGMKGFFPIWKMDSRELAHSFVALGFQAVVVSVDSKLLDQSFAGSFIEDEFIQRLPPGVDPCGENGEFHSFVFDGPLFRRRVSFMRGEVVRRDAFWYCDLLPIEDE
jgi:uncharacterized protein (TIGR00290 family)